MRLYYVLAKVGGFCRARRAGTDQKHARGCGCRDSPDAAKLRPVGLCRRCGGYLMATFASPEGLTSTCSCVSSIRFCPQLLVGLFL